MTTDIDWAALRAAASEAAANAYAPYSGLHVGAAALTDDGRIVTGANVENASFGLTFCAEVSLIGGFVTGGGGGLVALVATDENGRLLSPCGRCRQILLEMGGPDLAVNETWTAATLLPGAFVADDIPADPAGG